MGVSGKTGETIGARSEARRFLKIQSLFVGVSKAFTSGGEQ